MTLTLALSLFKLRMSCRGNEHEAVFILVYQEKHVHQHAGFMETLVSRQLHNHE